MWDKGLADEIESMFSALLVPETDGLHAKRLKEDPEFLERRREQWRRSKARKKAA
jgi:hypothetical protein